VVVFCPIKANERKLFNGTLNDEESKSSDQIPIHMEPTAKHQYDRISNFPPKHEIIYLPTLYLGLCTAVVVRDRIHSHEVLVFRVPSKWGKITIFLLPKESELLFVTTLQSPNLESAVAADSDAIINIKPRREVLLPLERNMCTDDASNGRSLSKFLLFLTWHLS